MNTNYDTIKRFDLGRIVARANIVETMTNNSNFEAEVRSSIFRHLLGDYGEEINNDEHDREANNKAIAEGLKYGRVFSRYDLCEGVIYIITERHYETEYSEQSNSLRAKNVTTIFFREDY